MIGTGGLSRNRKTYVANNSLGELCSTLIESRGVRRVAGNVTTTVAFEANRLALVQRLVHFRLAD